jgi:hypothetical protein
MAAQINQYFLNQFEIIYYFMIQLQIAYCIVDLDMYYFRI